MTHTHHGREPATHGPIEARRHERDQTTISKHANGKTNTSKQTTKRDTTIKLESKEPNTTIS